MTMRVGGRKREAENRKLETESWKLKGRTLFSLQPPASGFTLVELLVTVALLALVAGAVLAMLAGGFQVWERFQGPGARIQWAQTAATQLRSDLRSIRRFTPIPFEGRYDAVSFPALVASDAQTDMKELGRLGYFFDSRRQTLCRAQHAYRILRRVKPQHTCSPVLTGVERARFSYYAVDADTGVGSWSSEWSAEELPWVVKVEMTYREDATRQPTKRSLLVVLPAAAIR